MQFRLRFLEASAVRVDSSVAPHLHGSVVVTLERGRGLPIPLPLFRELFEPVDGDAADALAEWSQPELRDFAIGEAPRVAGFDPDFSPVGPNQEILDWLATIDGVAYEHTDKGHVMRLIRKKAGDLRPLRAEPPGESV